MDDPRLIRGCYFRMNASGGRFQFSNAQTFGHGNTDHWKSEPSRVRKFGLFDGGMAVLGPPHFPVLPFLRAQAQSTGLGG
jgi:hypothetical protein